ncbi:rho GDP-dissociation inhibitor [Schizopora paradoxa]|uniref:Rho GDP-dissociation inhibitor n=1 Tax=Schizopora paradoxa TaxID=27342 RepID=A0A0H2R820_9AGAM|nr:rho GDP-dissociation inhibitor [Schizopora paradoxa]
MSTVSPTASISWVYALITEQQHEDEDLKPSDTPGYKVNQNLKSVDEYAKMDANDESLKRWKESLGIAEGAAAPAEGPQLTVLTLELESPTLNRKIVIDVQNPTQLAEAKKNPITIKEGVEYNALITFKVNHGITSGVRYIQVVKRAGIKVDKLEQMVGSYGPHPEGKPYSKAFPTEESPSGMLARSGSYGVRSRVIDDDGHIYADFEWSFKLAKEW